MLVEEQIQVRRERAPDAIRKVISRPRKGANGDYEVQAASGKKYRVAMRGPGVFENYCSCPDFAVNTLGTCKHIEALLLRLRKRHRSALAKQRYERQRASLALEYGAALSVKLQLPDEPSPQLQALSGKYFDSSGAMLEKHYPRFTGILDELRRADDTTVVYSDVLEFIDRQNELSDGMALERRELRKLKKGTLALDDLLKVPLYRYQMQGALFAACRGRVVLADDMGPGKTIEAIAATELLHRRQGIERVLVVAPASVKYQWKTEIEKFCDRSAQVIQGYVPQRRRLYAKPCFFNLTSYELVMRDLEEIHELRPDLIILDEAQRIRNWETKTARAIKQLKSRYAFVLTGTPLENKLEELYSVVEFVDGRRLGPAFQFLQEHVIKSDTGQLLGYRGLERIHKQLEPIFLRRTRKEVLTQLPERTDQIFRVPLTKEQANPYWEQSDILARLIHKWNRQRWLSEVDRRRILCCIQNMRMLCNSTFLFDKETHHSPKLKEFREIVRELVIEEGRKVVVFSEYERMTHLAGEELKKLKIGFERLHGGVPSAKRGKLLERFRKDADCKVFLSTDAGGVGLNLQAASAVINFEPPWNPARLEQRIGRVHRLGQTRPVQVIHLLTEGSIEERVWKTLQLKKALFSGLFDQTADEISFEKLGRKSMMQVIKETFADGSGRPEPETQPAAPAPKAGEPEPPSRPSVVMAAAGGAEEPKDAVVGGARPAPEAELAAAAGNLLEAGVRFLESLSPRSAKAGQVNGGDAAAGADRGVGVEPLKDAVASLVRTDPETNRPVLAFPLPETLTAERISDALGGLLSRLARG